MGTAIPIEPRSEYQATYTSDADLGLHCFRTTQVCPALAHGLLLSPAGGFDMRQHRQIHLWVSESDYLLLHDQAAMEQDSVSAILRRLIRNERHRLRDAGQRGPSQASVKDTGECTSQMAAPSGWSRVGT